MRRSLPERQLEPPENYENTPCDDCSIFGGKKQAPEGFEEKCNEDCQDIENCPLWDPEPLKCDACGKNINDGDMCLECQREEARMQNEDDWNPEHLARFGVERILRIKPTEEEKDFMRRMCIDFEEDDTTEEEMEELRRIVIGTDITERLICDCSHTHSEESSSNMEKNTMNLENKQITIDGITYVLKRIDSDSVTVTVGGITLADGMKKINLMAPIVNDWKLNRFTQKDGGEGLVHSFLIGNDSGKIKVAVWGKLTSNVEGASEGDTLFVENAYCKLGKANNKGQRYLELHVGEYSMVGVTEAGT